MANGLVGVTMADTTEYFTMFHLALSSGGVMELLYTMLLAVVAMVGMILVIEKLTLMLKRVNK